MTRPKAYGGAVLTGGGEGALDRSELDGDILNDLDLALVNTAGILYPYWLDDDSGLASDSPLVIPPGTNPGIKNWILQGIHVASVYIHGITPTITLDDDTYSHRIVNSQAEGLAGSDLRIGLDESNRTLIIGDSGDVDTDLGLTVNNDPSLYILDATPTNGRLKLNANGISMELGRQLQIVGSRAADPFVFTFSTDLFAGNAYAFESQSGKELTDTDAEQAWMYFEPKINQSGTANYVGLLLDVIETALGSGANYLADLRVGGSSKFNITNTGDVIIPITKTPASAGAIGTTGNIAWDSNYIYVCITTDTWKRTALSTW